MVDFERVGPKIFFPVLQKGGCGGRVEIKSGKEKYVANVVSQTILPKHAEVQVEAMPMQQMLKIMTKNT